MRLGQKNGLVRQRARRGSRPRQPADQRYESATLFGAICPARGVGAALAMPHADTEAMQRHLDEIARTVRRRAHAVLLLDRAGWHTTGNLVVPRNMTLIVLPSRAPELNPPELVEGQDRLAVHARQLAVEPRFRQLRDHRRCRPRGLEQAHRPASNHHLHRPAGMGTHRSDLTAVGIITYSRDRYINFRVSPGW